MADEFIKGLGIFTTGGLGWMVLAGWYRTPSFESTQQLVAPIIVDPASADVFNLTGILLMQVLFWFTIIGTLTFWVVIPAAKQARETIGDRGSAN
jgi:hypothetical protein